MQATSTTERDLWFDRLERAACFDDDTLARSLEQLESDASVSLRILDGPILDALVDHAGELAFRPARNEVGKPERRVYQEFQYCGGVPADHPFTHLGAWMERRIHRALARITVPPLPPSFTINDVVCQAYRPGDLGITPHRDHISYTGLISLVVLSGRGQYYVCGNRAGQDRRDLHSGPGWALLMPGPGYAGRSDRPFHGVSDIRTHRYSVGLRQDARKPGRETE